MKFVINLTKKEREHIKEHSFSDNCTVVWDILLKLQKEVNKK